MSTNYPGALDSLSNPAASNPQNSATVPHAQQHANANDAIEAIQAELGTNPSGASSTVKARLDSIDATIQALGDTAFGAIPNGSVDSAKLATNAVTTNKITNSAVTADKLASNSVTEGKILDSSVSQNKLKSKSVGYSKVDDANWVFVKRTSNQSIPVSSGAYISWNTETADRGGFITVSSDTITVPAGKGGLYSITFNVEGFENAGNNYIRIDAGGEQISAPVGSSGIALCSAVLAVPAGGTVKGYAYNASLSTIETVTAKLVAVRLFANYD